MKRELLRLRLSAATFLIGLAAACQGPALSPLPDQYLSNPAVETCAARAQSVEAVRGELVYDAEHDSGLFRPSGTGTLTRTATLEIGRGEPFQALAESLRRTNRRSIEADVTFDGWLLRKSVCPFLDGDTYFIRQFTNISVQDTETL